MKPTTTETKFEAVEVAFRIPGKEWKVRSFKSQAALDKFLEKLEGEAAEVRFRAAE